MHNKYCNAHASNHVANLLMTFQHHDHLVNIFSFLGNFSKMYGIVPFGIYRCYVLLCNCQQNIPGVKCSEKVELP